MKEEKKITIHTVWVNWIYNLFIVYAKVYRKTNETHVFLNIGITRFMVNMKNE